MARIGYDTRTWKTGVMSGAAAACICSGSGSGEAARGRAGVFATVAMPRRTLLVVVVPRWWACKLYLQRLHSSTASVRHPSVPRLGPRG